MKKYFILFVMTSFGDVLSIVLESEKYGSSKRSIRLWSKSYCKLIGYEIIDIIFVDKVRIDL